MIKTGERDFWKGWGCLVGERNGRKEFRSGRFRILMERNDLRGRPAEKGGGQRAIL
jgi:hypothetical protein